MRFAMYHPIGTTLVYGALWAAICGLGLQVRAGGMAQNVLNLLILSAFCGYCGLMAALFCNSRGWALVMGWIGLLVVAGGHFAPLVMVWLMQALLIVAHNSDRLNAPRWSVSMLVELGLWGALVAIGMSLPVHGPLGWGLYVWTVFVIQALRIVILFNLNGLNAQDTAAERAERLMTARWHMF